MFRHRSARGALAVAGFLCAAALAPPTAQAQINIDTASPAGALTFSKELLTAASRTPGDFYRIGDFVAADDQRLRTVGTLGDWRLLPADGIWIRYDLDEHLRFRGRAPQLVSTRADPATPNQSVDVFDGGLGAANAGTFTTDGFLLFHYDPPDQLQPLPADTTLELDLAGVLATSGRGDGALHVRAFRELPDALDGTNSLGAAKRATVVRVARTVTVAPRFVTQTVVEFTQFEVGSPAPLGGFEIRIDDRHVAPNGEAVPAGVTPEALRTLNVDIAASSISFDGDPGFAFAPADGGWSIRALDSETGLCQDGRAPAGGVHAVGFGAFDADYPDGPALVAGLPAAGYLCAAVPAANEAQIAQGDYYLTVTLVAADATRPFPPTGVSGGRVGTVRHQGTTVHIPFLRASPRYVQQLTIVNRNARPVPYRLALAPGGRGTADPSNIDGVAAPGVTTLVLADVTVINDTTWASGTLTLVSHPRLVDVATVTVNSADQSTDTVVYRGRDAAP